MSPTGVILCDDLIFISKVQGTARAYGLAVVPAKTPAAATAHAKAIHANAILVDLHTPGLELPAFLLSLTENGVRPTVIGFGSHVDVKTLKAARAAGCEVVMPRSQFVAELESSLPKWLSPSESPLAE